MLIGWNHMLQQTHRPAYSPVPAVPVQSEFTVAVHSWNTALLQARSSDMADLYACVVTLTLSSLARYTTIRDLLTAYQSPASTLTEQVMDLCGAGDARLDPHVAFGAACALRLRQLMEQAIA
jgi:hypothetical protein